MKYLLDTDICIYLISQSSKSLINKIKAFEPGEIGLSVITVSELQFGIAKSKYKDKNRQALDIFTSAFDIIEYDIPAAYAYGELRTQLQKAGQLIGPLDMLIAAQALSRALILVTNNETEFKRVNGLKIENWTK
jgi:tRNA(fMet)-specific endonuclease VapC